MKGNDLRIGNWVKVNDPIFGVNTYKVATIRDNGIITLNDNMSCLVDNIEPIELTGDILINIGFKKGYNEIYSKTIKVDFYEYNISYQNVKDNKYSFVAYGYKNGELKRKMILDNIQYLHELQNVFFSFTNQELEMKL